MYFDIGSNVGKWSLENVNKCEKIISIEASPITYKKLQNNCKNEKIILLNYAVCNNNGNDITFYNANCDTLSTINKDWLENQIALFKNPELNNKTEYIIDLIKAYQLEMKTKINPKTKKPISDNTIRNFNTTLMRLGKFEQHKNKRYLVKEIGLTFKVEYVS